MKKCKGTIFLFLILLSLFLCSGCINYPPETEDTFEQWGSFTPDKTYSYDEKYYALQEVEKNYIDGFNFIKVCIYETETDTLVSYFYPARSMDFWGICWENDTYNIWIQSGDIGIYCYKYDNKEWKKDTSADRPNYIISKYDDNKEN